MYAKSRDKFSFIMHIMYQRGKRKQYDSKVKNAM